MVNMLSVHTIMHAFLDLVIFLVLYCTAYGTKERGRISTGGLDLHFCTVVYIW